MAADDQCAYVYDGTEPISGCRFKGKRCFKARAAHAEGKWSHAFVEPAPPLCAWRFDAHDDSVCGMPESVHNDEWMQRNCDEPHAFLRPAPVAPVAPEAPRRRELTRDEQYACDADCVRDPAIAGTLTQDEQTGFNAGYRAALAYAATRGYKPGPEPRCSAHTEYGDYKCVRYVHGDGAHFAPNQKPGGKWYTWGEQMADPTDLAPEGER